MLIKTDEQNLYDIANAIRETTGSTLTYKDHELADALGEYIPVGGTYHTLDDSGNITGITTIGDEIKSLAYSTDDMTISFDPNATRIGAYAFYNSEIKHIELPDTITSIGKSAFESSACVITTLPANLTTIGENAFRASSISITELPSGVTEIPTSAFSSCYSITSLKLHKNISRIGMHAFLFCIKLTEVTFEGTPNSLGYRLFYYCDSLTTINVPWSEGDVLGAPWGADNATINYNYTGS